MKPVLEEKSAVNDIPSTCSRLRSHPDVTIAFVRSQFVNFIMRRFILSPKYTYFEVSGSDTFVRATIQGAAFANLVFMLDSGKWTGRFYGNGQCARSSHQV